MRSFWDWGWLARHLDLVGDRILEHLWLTFLAVGIGLLIAFPLAVLAYRRPRWYPPLTSVTGILYTIPSLALFAFLLPWTGLSTLTAEIGLVSYTLLILIRNTVTGFRGVPSELKEAARGMGYTKRQLLWRVELPLALPAIVGGLRIATVTTIGLVTVTALIGQGGLGALMLGAFRRLFPQFMIVVAVALSVALAIGFDALFLLAQRGITPWSRTARVRGLQ
ncbi:MAG: ABC transporter permease [Actinomycetota bacterium]